MLLNSQRGSSNFPLTATVSMKVSLDEELAVYSGAVQILSQQS